MNAHSFVLDSESFFKTNLELQFMGFLIMLIKVVAIDPIHVFSLGLLVFSEKAGKMLKYKLFFRAPVALLFHRGVVSPTERQGVPESKANGKTFARQSGRKILKKAGSRIIFPS